MIFTNNNSTVVEQLRESIISGELKPNQALKQDALAKRYGVSKIPLREALSQLKTEGLIMFNNNRGSRVSTLSAADVEEIYMMRIAIETMLLKNSMRNISESDFVQADNTLRLIDLSNDPIKWAKLNWQFHVCLYQPANMPKAIEVITYLHNNVMRYLLLYLQQMNFQVESQKEHHDLINACKHKDIDLANKILIQHMESAMQTIIKYINKENNNEN